MKKIKFKINMDCASCANVIKKQLKKDGFIAELNPTLKIAKIEIDNDKVKAVISSIKKAGYDAKKT